MVNPTRLILARKRRSLTARELAELAGITPVHISRIENGVAENIEPATVEALAKALRFPIRFFEGEDISYPSPDEASFRSLTGMSSKERDSALSAAGMAFLLADWTADRFNLPKVDLLDLRDERDPAAASRALRAYWGLGEIPITNVVKLLESKGVRVFSLSETTKNVDAFSCWRNNIPYVFLNTFKTPERSRFDALHELGHLVLHRHGESKGRKAENEADAFASNFLMPTMDVTAYVPFVSSLAQLIKAKKRWGASLAALAYRLHKLGRLSDWQYRTFCIQIRKNYGDSEPNGIEREKSVVWEKVFRELWKEKATRDSVAAELNIPADQIDPIVFNLVAHERMGDAAKADVKKRLTLA